ncbi:TrkA family potassium uptake protein [Pseudomonas sp.]|uniref:potassium channel family protein n=1 Tax=Pseudomonas sp. TaxID=306 RepID=UPI0028B1C893|nr:TrkA family potassium uptake protein [Pseudomonas sp.]
MLANLFGKTFENDSVAVIGLGRFGSAVAESLTSMGHEVLGIDNNSLNVQHWVDRLTHVAEVDSTDVRALRQLGVDQFRHVVVSIGSDLEASVLTVLALQELGVPDIWAKALSKRHGLILERTGAHHVVYPEASMGERVAHLVTGKMFEFIEFDDGFAIASTSAPRAIHNQTLADAGVRKRNGVTIIGVKRPREDFIYATPETLIHPGDILVVAGETRLVEKFAAVTA